MVPDSAIVSQLRKGVLEYCVLALLRDQERYSYEIVTELAEIDGLVTSEGTLYPLLSRLRKDGSLESSWQESASGPPRRYYRLTPEGEKRLNQFIAEWQRFCHSVDSLLQIDSKDRDDH